MDVVWSPAYEVDIGPHVFPTRKYRLVKERLVAEAVIREEDLLAPSPVDDDAMARVHDEAYLTKIREADFTVMEQLLLEVPFSPELREAMVLCCGGTLLAARRALDQGVAVHLGGGFHHAFAGHGEGFCLLNDVAVAIRSLQADGEVGRVAVVDLDVHHGNGTAAIFAGDATVFTFSMHQENNYPAIKPPGDLDVGLDDGTDDATYLGLLDEHLPRVLDGFEPDLVVYLAGADPYRDDQLGGLALSLEGLAMRDRRVFEYCRERGVPVAVTLAGGYAVDPADTVSIHCATVREAVRVTQAGGGSAVRLGPSSE